MKYEITFKNGECVIVPQWYINGENEWASNPENENEEIYINWDEVLYVLPVEPPTPE